MSKTLVGTVANDDDTSTVTYHISVTQSGNDGFYDLDDQLTYGDGAETLDATVVNISPGDISVDGTWDGVGNTRVADDVAISAGASHVCEVSARVAIRRHGDDGQRNGSLATTESGTGFLNRPTR